jgi:hypothetical protein
LATHNVNWHDLRTLAREDRRLFIASLRHPKTHELRAQLEIVFEALTVPEMIRIVAARESESYKRGVKTGIAREKSRRKNARWRVVRALFRGLVRLRC